MISISRQLEPGTRKCRPEMADKVEYTTLSYLPSDLTYCTAATLKPGQKAAVCIVCFAPAAAEQRNAHIADQTEFDLQARPGQRCHLAAAMDSKFFRH
eukprot:scaffold76540_cov29-Prasinocladus_malaysianus.AAC.1